MRILLPREKSWIYCAKVCDPPSQSVSCLARECPTMNYKSVFAMPSLSTRKRVLIVTKAGAAAQQRSEFLRRNGYEVDTASSLASAVEMTRTHSYDLVVLALNDYADIKKVASQIQRLNPNTLITCLTDVRKAIPPLPSHRMLWTGEPLEYFLARVEALAATA